MSTPSSNTRYCARCLSTFEEDHAHCPNLACRRPRPDAGWGRMYGPGDLFDRHYRIHQLLALGGAGVTYLAREVGTDGQEHGPRLALKVLFATRDEGPYLRRLATEAQLLQQLDHPNIVQYLGFVHRAGHSPYLVTRFEPGGSLLDHVKRVGALPVKQAAGIARQVCWALEKAHARNVVHRDLKPENVLLSKPVAAHEDPVCRVADFGIAKVQGSLSGQTRVGAFVGTPMYAAPEQFVGAPPTSATDVYAIGALLYFCTMVMPVVRFADRLDPEDSYQLLVDALPPSVRRADEPEDDVRRLNDVLAICMAPDSRDRCSVQQLEAMLGAICEGTDPDLEAGRPRRAAPTLSTDPDTGEVIRTSQAELPAPAPTLAAVEPGPASTTPRKTKTGKENDPITPSHTRSGDTVSAPFGTTVGSGEEAAPDTQGAPATPAEPAASAHPTAEDPAAEDPAAEDPAADDPAADDPAADEETAPAAAPTAPEPVEAAPPKKKRGCSSCLLFLVVLLGLTMSGGYAGALLLAPGVLPDAVRPAPRTVDADDPADRARVAEVRDALEQAAADCGSGRVTVKLVLEPRGQVRSARLSDVGRKVDAACVGQAITDASLPAQGWRPVRMGLRLSL